MYLCLKIKKNKLKIKYRPINKNLINYIYNLKMMSNKKNLSIKMKI